MMPEEWFSRMTPEAHRFVCARCRKPVHPWDDVCPFCGFALDWPGELKRKYPRPDWFSMIFERGTSFKRWKERRR